MTGRQLVFAGALAVVAAFLASLVAESPDELRVEVFVGAVAAAGVALLLCGLAKLIDR